MTEYADRWHRSPDGLRLYARDYEGASGDARLPVICIHGLTRNSADFGALAPEIAATGRRVLAVDVRGRGRSQYAGDPMTYRPDVYAKDILALLEQTGIAKAVFVGTSMGGLITMTLAGAHAKKIAGAVINDVGPEVAPEGLARIAAYAGQPVAVKSWADAAAYVKRNNEVAFPHYEDADWDAFARRAFRKDAAGKPVLDYDPDISAPMKAGGGKALVPNLWPYFRRLTKGRPTLLIRGGASDLLSRGIADKMLKAAPEMAFAEVPNIGHAPMLDEPAAKSAIMGFLDRVP